MVVAILARAKLGVKLIRFSGAIEVASDQVESREGMKKCCSSSGVVFAEVPAYVDGTVGIGGCISGVSGAERTVTPGM